MAKAHPTHPCNLNRRPRLLKDLNPSPLHQPRFKESFQFATFFTFHHIANTLPYRPIALSRNGSSTTSSGPPGPKSLQYQARATTNTRTNRCDAKTAGYRCAEERNDRPRIRCEIETAGHSKCPSPATSSTDRRSTSTTRATATRTTATHHSRSTKARSSRSRKVLEEPGFEA